MLLELGEVSLRGCPDALTPCLTVMLLPCCLFIVFVQTGNLPTAGLTMVVFGTTCDSNLQNELVQSINVSFLSQAPPELLDNLLVSIGGCSIVSCLSI
jgi:hypothetical protein